MINRCGSTDRTRTASESINSTMSASLLPAAAILLVCCVTHPRSGGHGRLRFTYTSVNGARMYRGGSSVEQAPVRQRGPSYSANLPQSREGTKTWCTVLGGVKASTDRWRSANTAASPRKHGVMTANSVICYALPIRRLRNEQDRQPNFKNELRINIELIVSQQ